MTTPGETFDNAYGNPIVAQPRYDLDGGDTHLPDLLERKCCRHKPGCGNIDVRLVQDFNQTTGAKQVAYRRGNGWNAYADGDFFYGPFSDLDYMVGYVNAATEDWPWDEDEMGRRQDSETASQE